MKVTLLIILWATFIAGICPAVFSQCKDISPSANQTVLEKKVLFDDAHQSKHFKQAVAPLQWLLSNAPTLSTGIYIKGAETFDALAQGETNPAKKQVYIDSLMIIYDLRIKNCGEEANVTSRKAISFFNFHRGDSKAKEILPLIDKAIELNGDKVLDAVAEYYMHVVKISADLKLLNEEQIMQRYDKVTAIIDAKVKKALAEGKPIDRYTKIEDDNIAILSTLVNINCEFVRKNLAPKFQQDPADINLAKKIFNFMLKDKCSDDPLWLQAAEVVHRAEKDFGLAKILALKYLSMNDFEKANLLIKEASQLAKTPVHKSEILGLEAYLEEKKNNKVRARELYRQALAMDPSKKEYYEKIGDLYFNSYDECAKQKFQMEDRLVFLIAYDMYQKAGQTRKMESAKTSFPSSEEIFDLDHKRGDKIKVACWINEETIIRTRN